MKNFNFYSAVLFLSSFLNASCNKNNESSFIDLTYVKEEGQVEDSFSEVDGIMESSLNFFNLGGREEEEIDSMIFCAVKSINLETKTITIDFGDGCEGIGRRVRKGKIIINYTDSLFLPGAIITTTFENFYINKLKIEGTRKVTNISESVGIVENFQLSLTNGRITWPYGGFATRQSVFTETWSRVLNPIDDVITVIGSASGITQNGKDYMMNISAPLLFRKACWRSGVFIAVAGVKTIISGDLNMIVDYGNGECDGMVTLMVDEKTLTTEATEGI